MWSCLGTPCLRYSLIMDPATQLLESKRYAMIRNRCNQNQSRLLNGHKTQHRIECELADVIFPISQYCFSYVLG